MVDKPEVAELLKASIDEVKTSAGRVKMLMRLAEKYSLCPSKDDGGNLGWIELASDHPRKLAGEPILENHELEAAIREAHRKMLLNRGQVYGPLQTKQGHHLIIVSNEFGAERSTEFTGSAL
ncbi:PpiC domain-containing protein [Nitrospina watsonii]|uniref:PpiC domain-containing protein n=1 Tax=Nitrospina watsonii TaxID=1323948 RepID=A0ABN8W2G0_9BACT|nr:PpiC domain-containing protein [Nitrospina watsonii]